MSLPDKWGEFLFAPSAFDSPTPSDFVAVALPTKHGFRFPNLANLSLWLDPSSEQASIRDQLISSFYTESLLTFPNGTNILLCFAYPNPHVFSIYLKADKINAPMQINLFLDPGTLTIDTAKGDKTIVLKADNTPRLFLSPLPSKPCIKEGLLTLPLTLTKENPSHTILLSPAPPTEQPQISDNTFSQLRASCYNFFSSLPNPFKDDPLLAQTFYKSASVLRVNTCPPQGVIPFVWTTPDRYPHKYMWLWDTAFNALGLYYLNETFAKDSIKAMLTFVDKEGFLSHWVKYSGKRSKIPQPPVLAWATWELFQRSRDKDFLQFCYPRLKSYIMWDISNQDRDGNGLLEWHDSDASGMDNSPRFDGASHSASIDFNCFLANELKYLAEISRVLNAGEEEKFLTMRNALIERINDKMWDEQTNFYYDLDTSGNFIKVKTVASFSALFAGVPDKRRAEHLIEHLRNPQEFWTPLPVPSVSRDEKSFSYDMWRGPVWLNYNYVIYKGLLDYGFYDLAKDLRMKTLRSVAHWYEKDGVIYEYYDAEDKVSPKDLHRKGNRGPYGLQGAIRDYNWSAAFFILFSIED